MDDTSTPGKLIAKVHDSTTYMPVWAEFEVVPGNVYDSLVGGTVKLQVNSVEVSGSTAAADNLEDAFDETGGSGVAMALESLTVINPSGTTLTIDSTGGNGHGVSISGDGSGNGMLVASGPTGGGLFVSGNNFGKLADATGSGSAHGFWAASAGTGHGIFCHAGGTGNSIRVEETLSVGGNVALQDGLTISRTTANQNGLTVTGSGTGHGAIFISGNGATGNGIQATAATTNGSGLALTGMGSGFGLSGSVGGTVNANVTEWLGDAVLAPTVPGVPEVDITHVLGDPCAIDAFALGARMRLRPEAPRSRFLPDSYSAPA